MSSTRADQAIADVACVGGSRWFRASSASARWRRGLRSGALRRRRSARVPRVGHVRHRGARRTWPRGRAWRCPCRLRPSRWTMETRVALTDDKSRRPDTRDGQEYPTSRSLGTRSATRSTRLYPSATQLIRDRIQPPGQTRDLWPLKQRTGLRVPGCAAWSRVAGPDVRDAVVADDHFKVHP